MTAMEITLITSKTFLILGLISLILFFAATLISVYRKKDYSEYYCLMIFSGIIVILAKFNLFVPFI
ncbi:MAG: hypothetical protein BWY74_00013 [Firmicutes bacterium ADurb.Bin419]|nr:MAG: hypothetical protein BWY74_00013 [Firmicutes bacterium ADurb.Bin419]